MEHTVIQCFYCRPGNVAELEALMSIANPACRSPFMHWLWTNTGEIRKRLTTAPPHSLALRLLERAELEGPGANAALVRLSESAARC